MLVTRIEWVWSRTEYQPIGGSSSMLAEAHQAPRGPSSSRPASHMQTKPSAIRPCLSADSASTLGPSSWFMPHCSQV